MASAVMFDKLPHHVVKQIVGYVAEETNEIDVFSLDAADDNIFQPLLHSCPAWRAVALSIMLNECDIILDNVVKFAYHSAVKQDCITEHMHDYYNLYVATVNMSINYKSIEDGTAVAQLLAETNNWICFPKATKLVVKLIIENNSLTDNPDAMQNVSKTVERLRVILPAITKVTLEIVDHVSKSWNTGGSALELLAKYLITDKSAVDIRTDYKSNTRVIDNFQIIPNLTSLECKWTNSYQATAELIHANASTLSSLEVNYHTFIGFDKLIFNSKKEAVVFSNLINLDLKTQGQKADIPLPQIDNAAPFPILKSLNIMFDYPFSDDLPFRGNRGSMVNLGLSINMRTIKLLNKFSIFTGDNKGSLEKLVLDDFSNALELPKNDIPAYNDFICMHLSTVKYLSLHGLGLSNLMHAFQPEFDHFSNIRLLSLVKGSHSFIQIIRIIGLCPKLLKLVCRISSMGSEFNGMKLNDIACHIKNSRYPLSTSLQTWNAQVLQGISSSITGSCILLLADVCPNLKNVSFCVDDENYPESVYSKLAYSEYFSRFRDKMNPQVAITLDQFKSDYFIRINRLHNI